MSRSCASTPPDRLDHHDARRRRGRVVWRRRVRLEAPAGALHGWPFDDDARVALGDEWGVWCAEAGRRPGSEERRTGPNRGRREEARAVDAPDRPLIVAHAHGLRATREASCLPT